MLKSRLYKKKVHKNEFFLPPIAISIDNKKTEIEGEIESQREPDTEADAEKQRQRQRKRARDRRKSEMTSSVFYSLQII